MLNINLCNETTINILLPAKLEVKNIFKYNLSDEYYNDECYVYTSDNGTDITLVDRKNEYINNNMSLCENECEYKGYNISTEKAECECKPKSIMSLVSEILANKDILFENIPDIKNSTNFKIIKCYKLVFSKEGLITNIGSYIILTMILINIVCLFIFIFKGNKNLNILINNIYNLKNKNEKKGKNQKEKKNKNNSKKNKQSSNTKKNAHIILKNKNKDFPPKKNDNKNKKINQNYQINNIRTEIKIDNSNNSLNKKKVNNLITGNKKKLINNKKINDLNDFELNSLIYKEAIKIDKRTYFQYYLSLIKLKQTLIFTFYTKTDYNLLCIKISLFFFSFSLSYTVNALFFNDATMHKIYIDHGKFNFIYQIAQIFYSTIIISFINSIITYLSLTEKNIIQFKNDKRSKKTEVKMCLKIKILIFYFLIIFFLTIFWYYISCFCAVYKNTQIYLIKDTLISFSLNLLYPFGFYLFPGIFRVWALRDKKKNKECLYKFSSIMQMI